MRETYKLILDILYKKTFLASENSSQDGRVMMGKVMKVSSPIILLFASSSPAPWSLPYWILVKHHWINPAIFATIQTNYYYYYCWGFDWPGHFIWCFVTIFIAPSQYMTHHMVDLLL